MRKLEVGSGNNPTDGYKHLDINSSCPCLEYCGDIRGLLSSDYVSSDDIQELSTSIGYWEEILAVHFIEHIEWIFQPQLFKLFYDLLNRNGTLYISTPNLQYICQEYLGNIDNFSFKSKEHPYLELKPFQSNLQWLTNFKLYSGCSTGDYHHSMYDKYSIKEILNYTGFRIKEITVSDVLVVTAQKV